MSLCVERSHRSKDVVVLWYLKKVYPNEVWIVQSVFFFIRINSVNNNRLVVHVFGCGFAAMRSCCYKVLHNPESVFL